MSTIYPYMGKDSSNMCQSLLLGNCVYKTLLPTVAVVNVSSSLSVTEGNSSTSNYTIEVELQIGSVPLARDVIITLSTENGTATGRLARWCGGNVIGKCTCRTAQCKCNIRRFVYNSFATPDISSVTPNHHCLPIDGSDYEAVSLDFTFVRGFANGTTMSFAVPIIGDEMGEPDETFIIQITPSTPDVATSVTITILNDDSKRHC